MLRGGGTNREQTRHTYILDLASLRYWAVSQWDHVVCQRDQDPFGLRPFYPKGPRYIYGEGSGPIGRFLSPNSIFSSTANRHIGGSLECNLMTTMTDGWPLDGTDLAAPTPGWQSVAPALMSDIDAAAYLLLAEGKDDDAAVAAINRLVDAHKLRPAVIGGRRRYSQVELDRYISDTTESWGQ